MSERIAYQHNRDHILKFAGMEKLTGEQIADELNRLYTIIAEQNEEIAALEREVEELRSLLSDVTCVAITMLYDTHKQDVLDEFTLDELKEVVRRSEHLQIAKVEHIYRRGFEALAGGDAIVDELNCQL